MLEPSVAAAAAAESFGRSKLSGTGFPRKTFTADFFYRENKSFKQEERRTNICMHTTVVPRRSRRRSLLIYLIGDFADLS